MKAQDIEVALEDDGRVLYVKGRRELAGNKINQNSSKSITSSYTTNFSQSFAMDASVDVENFTATLQNGVLIVTAPKDMQRIKNNIRKIAITELSGSGDSEETINISNVSDGAVENSNENTTE